MLPERSIVAGITEQIDLLRLDASRKLNPQQRAMLGQFMTPAPIARLMASMLACDTAEVALLDPGAGIGSLLSAAIEMLCTRPRPPRVIRITAYEIDPVLADYLQDTLRLCAIMCGQAGIEFVSEIIAADFIAHAVDQLANPLFAPERPAYTCAILNPPYRKIHTESLERRNLRRLGIETSNLYICYRTENPFAMCGTVGGSMGNRKLTGTRNPSRSAYCIARSPI